MKRPLIAVALLLLAATSHAQIKSDAALAAKPGTGLHFVYMVRHGIYDRDTTATDDRVANGLNALGHEQAKLVGARLAALPVKFDRLISSQFLRAKETADDMGALMKLAPTRDEALNECTPTSNNKNMMTGDTPAETAQCDSARVVEWARYFAPTPERDTYDVLVCHGNVIRWTLMKAVGADPKNWHLLDSGNCSLTIFAVRPDGSVRLIEYSDVGHLPVEKQTWSGRAGGWMKGR